MNKKFKISPEEFVTFIKNGGGCMATDKITVEGRDVGYMYREEGSHEHDNGWRFFAGDETQEYIDNPSHSEIYDINTIANYDPAILEHIDAPYGTAWERIEGTNRFREVPFNGSEE